MTTNEIIGSNINTYMKRAKYSQHDLEKVTGIPQSTLNRYIRGICAVSPRRLEVIADALECTIGDLHENPLKRFERENAAASSTASYEVVPAYTPEELNTQRLLATWGALLDYAKVVTGYDGKKKITLELPEGLSTLLVMQKEYKALVDNPDVAFDAEDFNRLMDKQTRKYVTEKSVNEI